MLLYGAQSKFWQVGKEVFIYNRIIITEETIMWSPPEFLHYDKKRIVKLKSVQLLY